MKFSCEKALLSAAVATTSRAVAVKSSIPAMEGILIEADTRLRLTGYNLETGIQATVPAEIQEPGSLVLSARLFGEIIRKMPGDRPGGVPRAACCGSAELFDYGAERAALHDRPNPVRRQ